jgi:hypothetical protein
MHPQDTSFLVNGFKPTIAAAQPQDVALFQMRQQLGAQQLQQGSMDLQQKQIEQQSDQATRQLFAQHAQAGTEPTDADIMSAAGPKVGTGIIKARLDAKDTLAKLQETQGKLADQEHDAMGAQGALIASRGYTLEAFNDAMQAGTQLGYGAHLAPMIAAVKQNPALIKQYADGMITTSAEQQKQRAAKDTADARKLTADTGATKEAAELPGQQAQSFMLATKQGAGVLDSATGQLDYTDKYGKLTPAVAAQFSPQFDGSPAAHAAINRVGMSPAEKQAADQKTSEMAETIKRDAETNRHNLSTESNAKLNNAIAGGRLAIERQVNGMKYGTGTQEYWVQQLAENPDSIKEMPAELRSIVGQKFKAATGLPLPTPLTGTAATQETAARTTLDNAQWLSNAMKNPLIAGQTGALMGRIGEASQSLGTAVGLSPEAERLGQEFRTRARQFILQDAKAISGGRVTKQVLDQLQASSANSKMDPNIMQGALDGATGNAQQIMDNADKQRFGGQSRTPAQRGMKPQAAAPAGGIPTPASQAEFGALPSGAAFKKPGDPKTYYKP